jgi:hypothetical protein
MATRAGSANRGKGKGRASSRESSGSPTHLGPRVTPFSDQAEITTLRAAQEEQATELGMLRTTLDAILDQLTRLQPTVTASSRGATPADSRFRPSPNPSSQSGVGNYRPKQKDPPRFGNNQGDIHYEAWKDEMLDKFEEDTEQFPTERSRMRYLFNRTEADAKNHLHPRYTREPENTDPYQSAEEMWQTLDAAFKNQFYVRDSREAYRQLRMQPNQTFQEFKLRFVTLASGGRIARTEYFDGIYDKMTTALRAQILPQRHLLGEDFEQLCTVTTGIDSELRRLNTDRKEERAAREAKFLPAPARTSQPPSLQAVPSTVKLPAAGTLPV